MKYYSINKLNNMLANIVAEGQYDVWQSIEEEKDALERCAKRKLYWEALRKIQKGK